MYMHCFFFVGFRSFVLSLSHSSTLSLSVFIYLTFFSLCLCLVSSFVLAIASLSPLPSSTKNLNELIRRHLLINLVCRLVLCTTILFVRPRHLAKCNSIEMDIYNTRNNLNDQYSTEQFTIAITSYTNIGKYFSFHSPLLSVIK